MAKKVFLSFHYKQDVRRVSLVKQIGALEEQQILDGNDWEKVKQGGDDGIRTWIAKEMAGKDCMVVLIGSNTAGRRWVNYEIKKAWADGLGVVGVYIHGLPDMNNGTTSKGNNPFDKITYSDGSAMSAFVEAHDPKGPDVYASIKNNIEAWVDAAIKNRNRYPK
jgi:MTH538 TIR-like domain (DUF1863)